MPDLIAQGPQRRCRWRRRLHNSDAPIQLGRDCGAWSVPWDSCVSRVHAELTWNGRSLHVSRAHRAQNPIYVRGEQQDQFDVQVGEHFVIGDTQFHLIDAQAQVSLVIAPPTSQQTFTAEGLRESVFRDAQQQIQALTRLPEILAGTGTDEELHQRLINLILTGILSAEAVAVVRCTAPLDGEAIEVLHWDAMEAEVVEFQPSATLIRDAMRLGQSVVYHWRADPDQTSETTDGAIYDWAFCTPLSGVACAQIAIYVTGNLVTNRVSDLGDELKFVELVGSTVSNVCELRRLHEQSAALAQFFSPPVREAVAAADPQVALAPRRAEVTVLFCDLRGFSRQTEQADNLFVLLHRVSEALGIMTRQILDFGGVVGDFHGDAAMGFWGWPLPDAQRVMHACQAAVEIQLAFQRAAQQPDHALSDFRVGMGLATGFAVCGKLGTVDQVKVTAFGPVVNLAARLEGMTRQLGTEILVDEMTARLARDQLPESLGRLRYIARVQPYGLSQVEDVYELIKSGSGSAQDELPYASDTVTALRAFRAGDWTAARAKVQSWPSSDPLRRFYLRYMAQTGGAPRGDWDGIIRFRDKP